MAEQGLFREDLYYRLNVVQIKVPPLREHPEDIPALLEAYLNFFAKENDLEPVTISETALKILESYKWHGNVRELRNFCENVAVMHAGEEILPTHLDEKFFEKSEVEQSTQELSTKQNELKLIEQALKSANGNKTKAAEMLGISRRTLHRKLNEIDKK